MDLSEELLFKINFTLFYSWLNELGLLHVLENILNPHMTVSPLAVNENLSLNKQLMLGCGRTVIVLSCLREFFWNCKFCFCTEGKQKISPFTALCFQRGFGCLMGRFNRKDQIISDTVGNSGSCSFCLHVSLQNRRPSLTSVGLQGRLGAWKTPFIFLQVDA